jgi:hypothetical protein
MTGRHKIGRGARALLGALVFAAVIPGAAAEEGVPSFTREARFSVTKAGEGPPMDRVAEVLQSLSTMEGIPYYSNTPKKEMVLYSKSYMVEDPRSRKKVPDRFDHPQDTSPCFFLQKDNSLGEVVYRAVFHKNGGSASMMAVNMDNLKVGPFTVINRDSLQIYISVTDGGGQELQIYALIQANIRKVPLAEGMIQRSFDARLDALHDWFVGQYAKQAG